MTPNLLALRVSLMLNPRSDVLLDTTVTGRRPIECIAWQRQHQWRFERRNSVDSLARARCGVEGIEGRQARMSTRMFLRRVRYRGCISSSLKREGKKGLKPLRSHRWNGTSKLSEAWRRVLGCEGEWVHQEGLGGNENPTK